MQSRLFRSPVNWSIPCRSLNRQTLCNGHSFNLGSEYQSRHFGRKSAATAASKRRCQKEKWWWIACAHQNSERQSTQNDEKNVLFDNHVGVFRCWDARRWWVCLLQIFHSLFIFKTCSTRNQHKILWIHWLVWTMIWLYKYFVWQYGCALCTVYTYFFNAIRTRLVKWFWKKKRFLLSLAIF